MRTQCPYCRRELILEFIHQKRCVKCGVSKPIKDYAPQSMNSDGKSAWCPECEAAYIAESEAKRGRAGK